MSVKETKTRPVEKAAVPGDEQEREQLNLSLIHI